MWWNRRPCRNRGIGRDLPSSKASRACRPSRRVPPAAWRLPASTRRVLPASVGEVGVSTITEGTGEEGKGEKKRERDNKSHPTAELLGMSEHFCTKFSAALSPSRPMHSMGVMRVVISSVRNALPGSSMLDHFLLFFPGIVRRVNVIDSPGAYPVDLHNRFLFGPGKMVGLWLHNGHAPCG